MTELYTIILPTLDKCEVEIVESEIPYDMKRIIIKNDTGDIKDEVGGFMTEEKICPFSMASKIREVRCCIKEKCMAWQPKYNVYQEDIGYCKLIEHGRY